MNKKSWKKYFIYSALIIATILIGAIIFKSITLNFNKTFEFNPYTYNLVSILLYGVVGVLMGLDYFVDEIKKSGKWKINMPKLIFIGVPALFFSLYPLLYYFPFQVIRDIISIPITFVVERAPNYFAVFQVVLGYSIITSFYKENIF